MYGHYTFEKRYYVCHPTTRFVCLSVCLSVCVSVCLCVCHQDCDEMAGLSNTVLSDAITPDNSSKMQIVSSRWSVGRIWIIWIIYAKSHFGLKLQSLWMDSYQILPICCSARGKPCTLRILRFIEKSICYGHFKGLRVGPRQSSTSYFHLICLKLTLLIAHYTST